MPRRTQEEPGGARAPPPGWVLRWVLLLLLAPGPAARAPARPAGRPFSPRPAPPRPFSPAYAPPLYLKPKHNPKKVFGAPEALQANSVFLITCPFKAQHLFGSAQVDQDFASWVAVKHSLKGYPTPAAEP